MESMRVSPVRGPSLPLNSGSCILVPSSANDSSVNSCNASSPKLSFSKNSEIRSSLLSRSALLKPPSEIFRWSQTMTLQATALQADGDLERRFFGPGRSSATKVAICATRSDFGGAKGKKSHSAQLLNMVGSGSPELPETPIPKCDAVKSAMEMQGQEEGKANEFSRRICMVLTAPLAAMPAFPSLGQTLSKAWYLSDNLSEDAGYSSLLSGGAVASPPAATPREDVKSWYLYRGEGFSLRIPPGYDDILDPLEEEEPTSSFVGERSNERPFAARFASPDRDEILSVVVKQASKLRLSFFETKDISDFGSLKDAAGTFVPAGAKIISARSINSKASRIPRKYYVFEFLMRGTHFSVSAGISKGRVFVLGASAPESKWKGNNGMLQLAASTFILP